MELLFVIKIFILGKMLLFYHWFATVFFWHSSVEEQCFSFPLSFLEFALLLKFPQSSLWLKKKIVFPLPFRHRISRCKLVLILKSQSNANSVKYQVWNNVTLFKIVHHQTIFWSIVNFSMWNRFFKGIPWYSSLSLLQF